MTIPDSCSTGADIARSLRSENLALRNCYSTQEMFKGNNPVRTDNEENQFFKDNQKSITKPLSGSLFETYVLLPLGFRN